MSMYLPFVNIEEPAVLKVFGRLSGGCFLVYALSLPVFLFWSIFLDSRGRHRVMVAWEGHSHVMEVKA